MKGRDSFDQMSDCQLLKFSDVCQLTKKVEDNRCMRIIHRARLAVKTGYEVAT